MRAEPYTARRPVRVVPVLAVIALAVALPPFLSSYWQNVLVQSIGVYRAAGTRTQRRRRSRRAARPRLHRLLRGRRLPHRLPHRAASHPAAGHVEPVLDPADRSGCLRSSPASCSVPPRCGCAVTTSRSSRWGSARSSTASPSSRPTGPTATAARSTSRTSRSTSAGCTTSGGSIRCRTTGSCCLHRVRLPRLPPARAHPHRPGLGRDPRGRGRRRGERRPYGALQAPRVRHRRVHVGVRRRDLRRQRQLHQPRVIRPPQIASSSSSSSSSAAWVQHVGALAGATLLQWLPEATAVAGADADRFIYFGAAHHGHDDLPAAGLDPVATACRRSARRRWGSATPTPSGCRRSRAGDHHHRRRTPSSPSTT